MDEVGGPGASSSQQKPGAPFATQTTDAQGRFAFDSVPTDKRIVLIVGAKRHAARRVVLAVGAPRTEAVVELDDAAILEGVVHGADGRPVVGASVVALAPDEPMPPRRGDHQWYLNEGAVAQAQALHPTATSGADGRFELDGVPLEGPITAVVQVSDRLEARSLPAQFTVPGTRQRRDVSIPRPGSLEVRFATRPGEEGEAPQMRVEGETVWFVSTRDDRADDGSYLLQGMSPGTYRVVVVRLGAPPLVRQVVLQPGERTTLEIAAVTGSAVTGMVVDTDGAPLAGVALWWDGPLPAMELTDEEGRFRFDGLEATPGRLRVQGERTPRRSLARTTLEGVVPGGPALRVVVKPAPSISGRILGTPPETRLARRILSKTLSNWGGLLLDERGGFEFACDETGTPALLVVETRGFAPLLVDLPALAPGERRDLGELRFSEGRTIAGVVRDEGGAPIPGTRVVVAERWSDAICASPPDGSFRFERMPDRATLLCLDVPGFPFHLVTVPSGPADALSFTVDRGGVLSIRVLDAAGAPVPGAKLTCEPDEERPYATGRGGVWGGRDADEQGRLEWRLEARGFRICAEDSAGSRQGDWVSVVVKRGERTPVELRIH